MPCWPSAELFQLKDQDQFKFMNMELQKQADLLLSKWHQSSAARVKDMSSPLPQHALYSKALKAGITMASSAARYPDILDSWQDRSKLTRAMANAISTGNWNIKRFRIDRAGVSQASDLGRSGSESSTVRI